jgi:hypothetical protein
MEARQQPGDGMKFVFRPPSQPRMRRRRRSRGITYAVVLLTTMLVATIGFSGIAVVRVQGRTLQLTSEMGVARRICLAGLDWAVFAIAADTSWRSNLGSTWASNFTVGEGKMTIEAVDPIDGVLANDSLHPVDVTVTGVAGRARQKCRARIVMSPQRSALACSLAADGALTISGALLNAEGPVYADNNVTASSAQVTADVEAGGNISGSTYAGTRQPATEPRKFPTANPLVYYNAVGTQIPLSELSSVSENLIRNGDFSSGTTYWSARSSGSTSAEGLGGMSGASASSGAEEPWLLHTGRSNSAAGPMQDIQAMLADSGPGTYRFRALAMAGAPNDPVTFRLIIRYQGSSGGTQVLTQTVGVSTGGWVALQGDFNLNWNGGLKDGTIEISTVNGTNPIRLDNVSLRKLCTSCPYVLEKALLSPTSNPYGAVNASGLYVINCNGADLIIRDVRIVGTLLVNNPGPNSRVEGLVAWEPAIANYPTLLVDGNMRIELATGRLAEKSIMVNLNPPGTPYRYFGGMSDANRTGYCDSEIRGLVYASGRLTLGGRSQFYGPVISRGDIVVTSQQITLRYDDTYSLRPPPAFEDLRPIPQILAGSIQQVVD